ncbi:MAG TPA: long-chain fatty acid--CoA ligase [Longimicrobiaceae bacterium]|nr:long-chain fatty acid--CoA ligase [Longimicrobiaceae bacterium]
MPSATPPESHSRVVALDPVERDTIPRIFLRAVDRYDRAEAVRHKEGGAWKSLDHREMEERVTRLAAALSAAGVQAGDRVAILSENRPEWAIVDYAVLGLGGVVVPIYATLPANQVAYILENCGARAIFASTPEQVAKVVEIRGGLPALEQVVAFDDPAGAPDVERFRDLLEAGRATMERGEVGSFREAALRVSRDDVATLIYTSGTTGDPKGVMLTHYNLASNVAAVLQHGFAAIFSRGTVALSFLPLSHVFERMVDYLYRDQGVCIAYAESMEKVADNLGEVRPNVAVSVPRLFDKIYTKVMGATGLRKRILLWASGVGERVVDERLAGREPSGALALQYGLADRLVFSKLRERVGGRLGSFISGGAPLSAGVARFFHAAGLPVYEGYGLTETSPVIAANRPGHVRLGTVGQVVPGVEVRIGQDGEILTRGPHVMKGYWNNPEATAKAIDPDGWFHTGDVGELDADGFLRITDRLKDLIVTAGGKNVAPQPVENAAAMSPFVAQAVMVGDRRPYTVLLLVPDFENLGAWAGRNGIDAADRAALVRDPRVRELLEQDALGRLDAFARYEKPKKVAVLPDELTVDSGALTPTLKVKRRVVEERYRNEIEALYADGGAHGTRGGE